MENVENAHVFKGADLSRMTYVYAALPVASFFLSLRLVYSLYTKLRGGSQDSKEV